MAKSAKVTSKKKSPVKKSPKKIKAKASSARKSAPAKKITSKKTIVAKKALKKAPAKAASKKIVAKKTANKKVAAKKKISPVVSIKKLVVKDPAKNRSKATKQNKISLPSTSDLNQQTAAANDYTEMIEGNNGMPGPTNEAGTTGKPDTAAHAIPAPEEKYGRPADPYHGKTTPVKGKSNRAPSGKKPLWNK